MENTAHFKKSLMGFNQTEVLDFIDELEFTFNSEMEKKSLEMSELQNNLVVLTNKTRKLEMSLINVDALVKTRTEVIEQEKVELEKIVIKLQNDLIESRVEVEKEIYAKQRLEEDKNEQIGRIFIDAQKNASELLEKAESDAFFVKSAVVGSAGRTIEGIASSHVLLEDLRDQMESMLERFSATISNLSFGLDEARHVVEKTKNEIEEQPVVRAKTISNIEEYSAV